jgi:hypothetical protein
MNAARSKHFPPKDETGFLFLNRRASADDMVRKCFQRVVLHQMFTPLEMLRDDFSRSCSAFLTRAAR